MLPTPQEFRTLFRLAVPVVVVQLGLMGGFFAVFDGLQAVCIGNRVQVRLRGALRRIVIDPAPAPKGL